MKIECVSFMIRLQEHKGIRMHSGFWRKNVRIHLNDVTFNIAKLIYIIDMHYTVVSKKKK